VGLTLIGNSKKVNTGQPKDQGDKLEEQKAVPCAAERGGKKQEELEDKGNRPEG